MTDDDLVPATVRLGAVVPPEDPEDWTRPLTWVAALGMVAAAMVTAVWLVVSPPASSEIQPMTAVVSATLAGGAALTGATQIGRVRAFAGTLGGGLFAALATVVVGAALGAPGPGGGAQGSVALSHASLGALAGLGGAGASAVLAAAGPRSTSRPLRAALAVPVAVGGALATLAAIGA